MIRFLVLLICLGCVKAQIGELASVFTNLLGAAGPSASGAASAASGAAGALGSIGSLYQLAQTALQLTGTGVGILNQASEGRWFSDLTNNIVSNQRELQDRLLSQGATPGQIPLTSALLSNKASGGGRRSIGGISSGPEGEELLGGEVGQLGKSFPAPDPDDYEEEKKSEQPEALVRIDKSALTLPTTAEPSVTLFPDETTDSFDISEKKHRGSKNRENLLKNIHRTEEEYYDDVKKELEGDFLTDSDSDFEDGKKEENGKKQDLKKSVEDFSHSKGSTANLTALIEMIRRSGLSEKDIAQLVNELRKNQSKTAEHRPTFSHAVVVTPQPITLVSSSNRKTAMHQQKPLDLENGDDSDLLNTRYSKVRAVPNVELKENQSPVSIKHFTITPNRASKYPRRTVPPSRSLQIHQHRSIVQLPTSDQKLIKIVRKVQPVKHPAKHPSVKQPVKKTAPLSLPHNQNYPQTAPTYFPWYTPANTWTAATPLPLIPNLFTINQHNPTPPLFSPTPHQNLFAQNMHPVKLSGTVDHLVPHAQTLPAPNLQNQHLPPLFNVPQTQPVLYNQPVQRLNLPSVPQNAQRIPLPQPAHWAIRY